MTHTWSDVAYGFFVGNGNDLPMAGMVIVFCFTAFLVSRVL